MLGAIKRRFFGDRFQRLGIALRTHCQSAVRSFHSPAWLHQSSTRAFAASLLLHLGIAICAAWSILPRIDRSSVVSLETEWTPPSNVESAVEISVGEAAAPSVVDGGSTGGFLPEFNNVEPIIANPLQAMTATWNSNAEPSGDLTRTVGTPLNPAGAGFGRGQGEGIGNGKGNGRASGDGKSFFGLGVEGKSFVYVLDCSMSMNHPHDSEMKTRFRRLKMELANSLSQLKPEQQFFIIFFNHDAIPMPAEHLVSAAPENRQHFLSWVDQVPAMGDTDPTLALAMALRLHPDVIYFLTDGCFSGPANDIVRTIHQSRTAIHTFSFEPWLTDKQRAGLELMRRKKASAAMQKLGEATYRRMKEVLLAEQVLQGLAEHNGGKYHVIP